MELVTTFNPSIEQIVKELDQFGIGLRTKALRSAVVYASRDLKKGIKNNVRGGKYSRGYLLKAIGHKQVRQANLRNVDVAIQVGATRKVQDGSGKKRMQRYKFLWLEGGRKEVRPKKKKKLAWYEPGAGMVFRNRAGPQRPTRPLTSALAASESAMANDFYAGVLHWVNKRRPIMDVQDR